MYGRAFGTLLMHSTLCNILRCDLLSPGMAYVPKARPYMVAYRAIVSRRDWGGAAWDVRV